MKEIIYIQAGELANYTGTHFWNTQESYFTYDDFEDPLTCHDVSFREGSSLTGEVTFCPRVLIFDKKSNFGTLGQNNALLGMDGDMEVDEGVPTPWQGNVVEYRQDPIAKSAYQSRMDEPSDDPGPSASPNNSHVVEEDQGSGEIRYWSDLSRVYYIPRSIQKLPDPTDWETPEGYWNRAQDSFARYNEDNDLMEGSLRLFLEECDFLQGIQVINDTDGYAGFMSSFLTSFRDDFLKVPSLVFPLLSTAVPRYVDVDDYQGTRKVFNDALYLRNLNELSSITIPIQAPSNWPSNSWNHLSDVDKNSLYQQSAILSTHIETSTLPLRLQGTLEDLSSFSRQLNWRGATTFGELSGVFPTTTPLDLGDRQVNFSAYHTTNECQFFSRRDVTRGFTLPQMTSYDKWTNGLGSPQDSFISRTHAPSYPLPTSFPPFFRRAEKNVSYSATNVTSQENPKHCLSAGAFSSISTSTNTSRLLFEQAKYVELCVQRRSSAVLAAEIELDDLRDLANDLWIIHDNYLKDGAEPGRYDQDVDQEDYEDEY